MLCQLFLLIFVSVVGGAPLINDVGSTVTTDGPEVKHVDNVLRVAIQETTTAFALASEATIEEEEDETETTIVTAVNSILISSENLQPLLQRLEQLLDTLNTKINELNTPTLSGISVKCSVVEKITNSLPDSEASTTPATQQNTTIRPLPSTIPWPLEVTTSTHEDIAKEETLVTFHLSIMTVNFHPGKEDTTSTATAKGGKDLSNPKAREETPTPEPEQLTPDPDFELLILEDGRIMTRREFERSLLEVLLTHYIQQQQLSTSHLPPQ